MSPDRLREQLSFLEEVDLDSQSLRSEGPNRRSSWWVRVLTGALLTAQVAVLGVFLHYRDIVRIPGLPPLDVTAPAVTKTAPDIRGPMASEVATFPPATQSGGHSDAAPDFVAAPSGGETRSGAPGATDSTPAVAAVTPEANSDDSATLPLRKGEAGPENARPIPEVALTEKGKGTGKPEKGELSPYEVERQDKINKKKLAERQAKKNKDDTARYRRMLAMKQEAQLIQIQREMIRQNTPRRTIHRDPNGQFMGAEEVYPNGTRVEYDRNEQIRQMDLVFPDGTRYSVGRDNHFRGRWNW